MNISVLKTLHGFRFHGVRSKETPLKLNSLVQNKTWLRSSAGYIYLKLEIKWLQLFFNTKDVKFEAKKVKTSKDLSPFSITSSRIRTFITTGQQIRRDCERLVWSGCCVWLIDSSFVNDFIYEHERNPICNALKGSMHDLII